MRFANQTLAATSALLMALTSSCSVGLSGGSIQKNFAGIKEITVLGPETIELNWDQNALCNYYTINRQSNSNSGNEVATATVPPARLTAPAIESDRTYTLAVGCVQSAGTTGLGITKTVSTWPQFNGTVNSSLDVTGQSPVVVLTWNSPATTPLMFDIYAKVSNVPGDLSTWKLNQVGGPGGGYSEQKICTVLATKARIGIGGDCSATMLEAGQIYNFKVVARYLDGHFSNDLMGTGTSILLPSTFTPPNCLLTAAGLGSDASSSYLFLRCDANGGGGSCSVNNMSIRAYQAINGTRVAVSDVMVGPGTLRIEPQLQNGQINNRLVENLEVEYTCLATTPATKSIVRYDGSQTAFPKPVLKYASAGYEQAPGRAIEQHPSFTGEAMAVGDFNCDGKPDLAVGFPRVVYAQSPYFSKNSETGIVKVYYGYARAADGTLTSTDTQTLSFRDLGDYSHFGQSLSAGNINRDVYVDTSSNKVYSCDDLIIGAPGRYPVNKNAAFSQAFIFYGHPQKFPQPLDSTSLAQNAPTCSGSLTNQVCAPVRLLPKPLETFSINPTDSAEDANSNSDGSMFGFSVSFIRDYNADGFGDVAIGDPYCDWNGEAINGGGYPTNGRANKIADVGCVYVYWGGPNGLQNVYVGKTPDGASSLTVPYVQVYPPFPQFGMHFGWSISGGGDVDGALPVPVLQNGGQDVILANGNEFIVGAPDFRYNSGSNGLPGLTGRANILPWTLSVDGPDPIVKQYGNALNYIDVDSTESPKVTAPWNGAWAPQTGSGNPWSGVANVPTPTNASLAGSSGIAFLYKGRTALKSYDLQLKNNFFKFPNLVTTTPLNDPLERLLSFNLRDRQNGSQFLSYNGTPDWTVSPVESFYNCGNRGAPLGKQSGSNTYKHISCLAGRNNFSVIYPILKAGDPTINRFAETVSIAGPKEQNAVALYQLGSFITASAYSRSAGQDLVPRAQGNTHDSIRGTSLWEVGLQTFNTPGSSGGACERFTDASGSNPNFSTTACPSYAARLARSSIREQFSLGTGSGFNSPQPDSPIQVDPNRDGYADVLIGTNNTGNNAYVYTYFGNFAADFSYSRDSLGNDTYGTSGGCNVARNTTGISTDTSGYYTTLPGAASPYSTFYTKVAVTNVSGTKNDWIINEYPQFQLPNTGLYQRLSYLEDTGTANASSGIIYNYQNITRSTSYASNCLVQRKAYSTAPSTITTADMNSDLVVDGILGMSQDSNSQGKGVISFAGQTGNGLIADTNFTNGTSAYSRAGSSIIGVNWKFIDETSRRDLFVGAPGFSSGAGIVLDYNAANTTVIGSVPSGTIQEDTSAPNRLQMEKSRIIGDVNGDGFDDIWIPIKRYALDGSIYYDATIYFGSAIGPITTSVCKSRIAIFKTSSGSSLSASDCEATTSSVTATVGNAAVRLPQYINRPTNVGSEWALYVYAAGDVDHDGKADLLVSDTTARALYLFFGSDSGFVNAQPVRGPSTAHTPQLISSSVAVFTVPSSGYAGNMIYTPVDGSFNFVHGDFNGDGYEDLVLAQPDAGSPMYDGAWTCDANGNRAALWAGYCGTAVPSTPPSNPGPSSIYAGRVVVLYGGPNGIQTPVSAGGVPAEFESPTRICDDFYANCRYVATGTSVSNHWSDVYRTLVYNTGTGTYEINTSKTACDPSTNTCKAQEILNPFFFNDTVGTDSFADMALRIGAAFTVADVNYDGIDDLVVGAPALHHYRYNSIGSTLYSANTIFGGTTEDPVGKGGLLVYYGAKGAGLVAPKPQDMVTDAGMAVGTAAATPLTNRIVFMLYPHPANAAAPATVPELERDGVGAHQETNRKIGIQVSSGDFNGDQIDDIATIGANGQAYIYYGPLCQVDNARNTWTGYVYLNHNRAMPAVINAATDCTVVNFNVSLNSSTVNTVGQPAPAPSKPLFPQMIYVQGTQASQHFGSVLVSQRPRRSPASTTIINNPGNINGDPERTSDLIMGSPYINDPNVPFLTYKKSGMAYIFFGHKTPTGGDMPTQAGLYIGAASYNSNIVSQVISGNNYYFFTPMLLRPYTSDAVVGSFFMEYSSTGDLNGDGKMDFVMPSADLHNALDGTPVVYGGGFKIFY